MHSMYRAIIISPATAGISLLSNRLIVDTITGRDPEHPWCYSCILDAIKQADREASALKRRAPMLIAVASSEEALAMRALAMCRVIPARAETAVAWRVDGHERLRREAIAASVRSAARLPLFHSADIALEFACRELAIDTADSRAAVPHTIGYEDTQPQRPSLMNRKPN